MSGLWGLIALFGCATDSSAVLGPNVETMRPVLGASDVIEVRVYGEEELSGDHRISPEGTTRLPLIGTVSLDGLTPEEAAKRIGDLYNEDYLRDAHVTVNVKEFNSRKVFVLGQVNSPGSYPFEEKMTIIAAIARAGGTSKLADLNGTIITRPGRKEGEPNKRVKVAIGDIRRGDKPDVAIEPGDIIFVPVSPF
jgi:polysaccharide export outer membrane protein